MKLSPSSPAAASTRFQWASTCRGASRPAPPIPADQREPGRGRGDARDLRGGQRLAVERHADVEVEQRVVPTPPGARAPT